jgi:glucose-1-phosphate thymidylyltransferase
VILVVGSNRERVQTYFEDGRDRALDITYVTQEPQLGTGHALLQAESHVGDSVVVCNGDRIVDAAAIDAVWERHRQTGDPTVAITRADHPHKYGVVDFDDDELAGIEESPHPDRVASEYINAGVYALPPEVFAALRETDHHGEHALTATLSELVATRPVRVVRYRGRWLDVSEPWDLLAVNGAILANTRTGPHETATVAPSAVVADDALLAAGSTVHPNATIRSGVTIGENVQVGPNVVVENSLVLEDTTLEPGAVVTDCVVGANATIGANTTIAGGTTTVTLNDTVYHDVPFGGLVGDNVTVGANTTVRPGAIVGNDATIEDGAIVDDRIEAGSRLQR